MVDQQIAFMSAPDIDTERLTLRAHCPPDFKEFAAMCADPVVTRFIGGRPFTKEEAWSRFLRYAGHWPMLGYGFWVIRERETGRFIGETGFHNLKREIEPTLGDAPEAAWALVPSAHGRGFAREAVRAAHDWVDVNLTLRRTVCIMEPENIPSLRVAALFDYKEYVRTTYKGSPIMLMERWRGGSR